MLWLSEIQVRLRAKIGLEWEIELAKSKDEAIKWVLRMFKFEDAVVEWEIGLAMSQDAMVKWDSIMVKSEDGVVEWEIGVAKSQDAGSKVRFMGG